MHHLGRKDEQEGVLKLPPGKLLLRCLLQLIMKRKLKRNPYRELKYFHFVPEAKPSSTYTPKQGEEHPVTLHLGSNTVTTRIKEHMISEVRLIRFLFNGCLVTNQPQSVLKMFLNFYISNMGTTQKCPYVFTVEKSITVETSVQYSIQKYDHLTADRVMTANIKSLAFYVIMTPFPFYKNMLNFSG